MTNASNFWWEKRGEFILGMTPRLKAVSNLPLGFPEYSSRSLHKVGPFDVISASLMSEVLKSYNKQTQGGDSWSVDKPKKSGEDVSMGGPH